MKKLQRVFVYGTLKNGFYFHDEYLGGDKSIYIGPGITTKEYSMYVDGLPHLIREPSVKGVLGELYEVDEVVLKRLDDLEGHPVVYFRDLIEVINVANPSEKPVLAWSYLRPSHFKGKAYAHKEEEFV